MIRALSISAVTALALALTGCGGQSASTTVTADANAVTSGISTATGYATTALSVAEAALAVYEATPKPNQTVIGEAQKLDTAARAALTQFGPEATTAVAAVSALATYLLTSAPGNGVTASTVPSAA